MTDAPDAARAAPDAGSAPTRTVDAHSHLMPATAFANVPEGLSSSWSSDRESVVLEETGSARRGRPAAPGLLTLAGLLDLQVEHCVDVSIVGAWVDAMVAPRDPSSQAAWCRTISETLEREVTGTSSLRWLAAVPDLDGARAADELSASVEAGAVGGMISTAPEVGGLGRPDLEVLWAAAERLDVPLVIHPGIHDPSEQAAAGDVLIPVFYPYLTTRAAVELVKAGVPDRYPDLKVILVHAGGFFPYQSGRILQWLNTSLGKGWQSDRAMSSVLSWFYYDTVAHSREVVEFLVERVGATQVLAGSDCPFAMADWSIFGEELALDLQPEARSAILGANAERIFPLGTAAR